MDWKPPARKCVALAVQSSLGRPVRYLGLAVSPALMGWVGGSNSCQAALSLVLLASNWQRQQLEDQNRHCCLTPSRPQHDRLIPALIGVRPPASLRGRS
jgi:hypothetical protein